MNTMKDEQSMISVIEEEEEASDSLPIEQVALMIPTADEPALPALTFRTWVLGTLSCAVLSFLNQFFWYRKEPLSFTSISAQIAVVPIARLMASALPDRRFLRGTRFAFTLNPGPFNVKEHVLITIFANSSVVLGYGQAGLFRRYLVEPTAICHIVPEYSFLDARGLGAFEGRSLDSIAEVYSSDSISPNMKPPAIDDGTPNESVSDVFVRVTQLMSILETQYSGDTVIIVSPDSDNLSILEAGLVGLDLRRHKDLFFGPGEVRFVDPARIPIYKQPASSVFKCTNPPSCT